MTGYASDYAVGDLLERRDNTADSAPERLRVAGVSKTRGALRIVVSDADAFDGPTAVDPALLGDAYVKVASAPEPDPVVNATAARDELFSEWGS